MEQYNNDTFKEDDDKYNSQIIQILDYFNHLAELLIQLIKF